MSTNYELPKDAHGISLAQAIEMTQRYRSDKQSILADPADITILPLSETFNLQSVKRLLEQPAAAAFRIYYGMTADKNIHAILVAADETGKDILPSDANLSQEEENILEDGQRCPYTCPPPSELNG